MGKTDTLDLRRRLVSETYVAFYPANPFWVDDVPDFASIGDNPDRFYEVMAEEMFVYPMKDYPTKDYTLRVCKDGLFLVRVNAVEAELDNVESRYESSKSDKPAVGNKRRKELEREEQLLNGKYYDYLNALL